MSDIFDEIKKDITENRVMLYMKGTPDTPMCGFSARVVDILNELGIQFASKNILEDEALRQGVKEFASWPTIPQLYVNGEFVGGCDIVSDLYQEGRLQEMVKATEGLRE